MDIIEKIFISSGVTYVSIASAGVYLLCGAPADVIKHLIRNGLIKTVEKNGVTYETGPNAILLSDMPVQNGSFANLSEFPVLQMLYRQGMIIPGHPNNNGQRPILIGRESQVKAQLNYIHRGNYGLQSIEELIETGVEKKLAEEYFQIKLKYAFGKIKPPEEIIQSIYVNENNKAIEIKNGVTIQRISLNQYKICYGDQLVNVDLNLPLGQSYRPAVQLGFHSFKRDHFTVLHTGEGDGWDINNPCMSSILIYNNHIYLIDAGPNIDHTLKSLGISLSEIDGVFHTHCHDDHFCGLTTLIQADHRIKYFSSSEVKHSVDKKLGALLGMEFILDRFFEVETLITDQWNNIDGLEVKPIYSPHPVETTAFQFRVISESGYKTYTHLADIVSFDILKSMLRTDIKKPGLSLQMFEKIKKDYLLTSDIKKIDAGGGMIHGNSIDFKSDCSAKIIISHTSRVLSSQEKEIGERVSFGEFDCLIESNNRSSCEIRLARRYFKAYYPDLKSSSFRDLLNGPIVHFNPGAIISRPGGNNDFFYMTLTGTVEMIYAEKGLNQELMAGSMIGEMSSLLDEKRLKTYLAQGHVMALKISGHIYRQFAIGHQLLENIKKGRQNKSFLSGINLFHDMAGSAVINSIAQIMFSIHVVKGEKIPCRKNYVVLIKDGDFKMLKRNSLLQKAGAGDVFFEEHVLEKQYPAQYGIESITSGVVFYISVDKVKQIPSLLWKLLEIFEKRLELF